ncbi:MAG TPA: hypothetical protein VFQ81_03610 [Candidatus Limnocylindria bacterium]|nr:hypothetical protein [Candidatus Limnocylindria bacterium]
MKRKIALSLAAATFAVTTLAGAAAAAGPPPDTECMRAGIATLKGAGLLDDAARGGVPVALAVSLGVTVRPGADISGLPDPIPFRVVLADHRAGDASLFLYPWCA